MSDDDEPRPDLSDYPELIAVARFAAMLRGVSWFAALGEPLTEAEAHDAQAYLDALGFPDCYVGDVAGWEEAESAVKNPDWNSEWWEAEEQLRAGLIARAIESGIEEEDLLMALTHVTSAAGEVVHGAAAVAAARSGCSDEGLIRAAAGAAAQACYQAALVLAAGDEPDHPFALKYRLFEAGRWPLGIVGATFYLF
ncbi:MAG: hypothetical protein FJX47_04165 [Alphaproteobacteria bacterium]|nr:hypothetical protein [Alphaproteobacteria bacterium]